MNLLERFRPKLVKLSPASSCWLWIGGKNKIGYGVIQGAHRRHFLLAHRASYELFNGPIPAGFIIDHNCRNIWCVNPDHLEIVDHRENHARGNRDGALAARTGFCKHGHELTPANRYRGRDCLICRRRRARNRP